jgi:hypothetical protein
MKITNYLRESVEDLNFDEIMDNCLPFLKELKKAGKLLKRGTKKRLPKDINLMTTRTDRHPLSSSVEFHDYCDLELNKRFGWYPRSSGVFTKSGNIISIYGSPYYVFIPGPLKFIWSPIIYDLFTFNSYFRMKKDIVDSAMLLAIESGISAGKHIPKSLIGQPMLKVIDYILSTYIDNNLTEAIQSQHEIMFKCDTYYMVKEKHKKQLEDIVDSMI